MFATQARRLTDEEAKQLCEKYVIVHRYRMVRPNEALFVDLRPAFSIPLSDAEPKESFPVPRDCIPELCLVVGNGQEIENASLRC